MTQSTHSNGKFPKWEILKSPNWNTITANNKVTKKIKRPAAEYLQIRRKSEVIFVFKRLVTKKCWEVNVQLHIFLKSELDISG